MSVVPIRSMQEAGVLRSRLEADRGFLEKVESKLSSQFIITRIFNGTSTEKYEKSKLLAAAEVLLEEDKEKIPKTLTQGRNMIHIHLGPVESENDHEQRLQSLKNTIDTCVAEVQECQNKKWFRQHQKTVHNFEGHSTRTLVTSLKIADLTQRDKDELIKLF